MPSPVRLAARNRPLTRRRSTPAHGRTGAVVLVADPCADTRETTAEWLRAWGYAVRTAASGPETLEAAVADRPDVVLMELALPLLDGLQVARRIRESVGAAPLLVAVTGFGGERDRARAREAGFDCHLVKPVCPEVVRTWSVAKCTNERMSDGEQNSEVGHGAARSGQGRCDLGGLVPRERPAVLDADRGDRGSIPRRAPGGYGRPVAQDEPPRAASRPPAPGRLLRRRAVCA